VLGDAGCAAITLWHELRNPRRRRSTEGGTAVAMTSTRIRILAASIAALACVPATRAAALVELGRIALPGVQGRIDHMAADPTSARVFVAALGNHSIEVVDLAARAAVRRVAGFEEPQGVALVDGKIVVADGGKAQAVALDTRSFAIRRTLALPDDPDNVRRNGAGTHLYIGAGTGSGAVLALVDARTLNRLGTVALPGHPESFQLEAHGTRIFVNVPDARAVVVVDRESQRELARWPLPAERNFPMALDDTHQRLLIGTRAPARLLVLRTDSGQVAASLPMVGDADDLFLDEDDANVYVSGGAGYVEVFHRDAPDRYRSVAKVPTRRGARTSLFLPDRHCLVVAVPAQASAGAELRLFGTSTSGDDASRSCM
jgi:DNA-binding beta-propeller fold protein YncE